MKVTILPHDPSWANEFNKNKAQLLEILQGIPIVSIEHIGSTSIPGLVAKPVLDIDIIVPSIPDSILQEARAALVKAGYFDCGEMGIPGRFQFRQPGYGATDAAFGHSTTKAQEGEEGVAEMRRNTYIMLEGGPALRNHLDLKRVLMEDEELREEYGRIKRELAERDWNTVGSYSKAKNEILWKILRKAGWSEEDLEPVKTANTPTPTPTPTPVPVHAPTPVVR